MKVPVEVSECKKWIKRWDDLDKPLVALLKKAHENGDKWAYLFGFVLHDGRRNHLLLTYSLGDDYDPATRHKIWGKLTLFVSVAEYMLDKEVT